MLSSNVDVMNGVEEDLVLNVLDLSYDSNYDSNYYHHLNCFHYSSRMVRRKKVKKW
jgi:hypothetical protein